MATPLDLGLIQVFSWVFPVLLIYALIFGILSYSKMFNPLVNQLIAISLALLTLAAPNLLEIIKFIAPVITIILVVVLLLVMLFRFLGASEKDIARVTTESPTIIYWAIFVFIIVVLAAIGKVYFAKGTFFEERGAEGVPEGEGLEGTPEAGELSFWLTVFHPNVMGMILVLLIAAFAMFALSGKASY